jgi:hypothetical protein
MANALAVQEFSFNSSPIDNREFFILVMNRSDSPDYVYKSGSLEACGMYGAGAYLSQVKFLKLQSRFNTFWSAVC